MAISVVINTYNASRNLAAVLDSVKDFDEIVVCDMESTDNTVEIAAAHGARVVSFPKKDYTYCEPARNFAISQARFDWVLVVDADELVTPHLRTYLYKFLRKPGNIKGLFIPRRNFILDRFRRGSYPDYRMRFFEKKRVEWPAEIHSSPEIEGDVGKIPSNRHDLALIHIPASIHLMMDRLNRYSSVEVALMQGKKVNRFNIVAEPFFRFLHTFILKGSIRYGIPGFIMAVNDSIHVFYRLAKVYEHNVRHRIAGGYSGDLPEDIVEEAMEGMEPGPAHEI